MATGYLPIDPDLLPTLNAAPQEPGKHSPFTSGLVRGVLDTLGGTVGAAVSGAGKLAGSPTVENAGNAIENYTQNAAPSYNRPDLEQLPFTKDGPGLAPWLEYQAAKQVPLMGAYILGGKGLAKAGIEAPEFLQRAAASAPRVLGGGGLRAGADFATRRAALEAGKGFAQTALGAEVVGLPIAAGSMYQEAQNKPGGATREDALKAAALSPFYAALDAVEPAQFQGLIKRGLAGGLAKRVATAGFVSSAAEVVQEGVQTAMEQSFRTDLSPQQKLSNIVNAAVTGGAVGGIFGGASAGIGGNHDGFVRAVKNAPADQIRTEDLRTGVDEVLGLPSPQTAGKSSATSPREGEDFTTVQPLEQGPSFDAQQPAPRPYENTSITELSKGLSAARKRIDAGTSNEAINKFVEAAHQELQIRNGGARNNAVDQSTVEAVEPAAVMPGGTSGAPVSTNTDITELTKGLRLPARLKTALEGAANADEVQDIIHDHVIVQGKAGKNVDALAQRAGVLDNDGKPTPLADAISTRKAGQAGEATLAETPITQTTPEPAAPANQEGGDQPAPAKMNNRQLLEALAANNPKEIEADLPAVAAAALTDTEPKFDLKQRIDDRVQQEAVRRGMLTKTNGVFDYSDKARDLMKRNYNQPIPTADTTAAANARGFKGADASQFDRGAQAFVRGVSFQKLGKPAWQAGHQWAEALSAPPITHAASQKTISDLNVGDTERGSITHDEKQAGEFNRQIDELQLNPTVHPTEVAQLKQMVANREPASEIHEAINAVRSGQPLIPISLAPEKPFKGEVITRGLSHAHLINQRQAAREGEAAQTLTKEGRSAADLKLIQMHQRRNLIKNIAERMQEERVTGQAQDQEAADRELKGTPEDFQRNRYMRGQNGVVSARADAVREHVNAITSTWKSNQKVHVIEQLDQLPSDVQKSLVKDGASDAYGFVRDGEVYLLAQNLPNLETATAALYHEALGHLGLHSLFRAQMDRALGIMYKSNKSLRDEVDQWRANNKGYYRNDDIALATEEVLAQRANGGRLEAGLLRKIAAVIKAFAIRMGLTKVKLSDNDIEAILAMAHDQVINGNTESSAQKGLRYMMMLWHGSPHDFNEFSTSKIGTGEGAQVYGHGLYFASIKDVAQAYRDNLAGKGKVDLTEADIDQFLASNKSPVLGATEVDWIKRQAKHMFAGNGYWQDYRRELGDERSRATREGDRVTAHKYQAEINLLNDLDKFIESKRTKGKLYQVGVKALDDQFMDWFKPLSEQSKFVQDALKKLGFEGMPKEDLEVLQHLKDERHKLVKEQADAHATWSKRGATRGTVEGKAAYDRWHDATISLTKLGHRIGLIDRSQLTGADIYHKLRTQFRSKGESEFFGYNSSSTAAQASQALLEVGIRGNKYQDQFTRGQENGSHNYVVFDDKDIEIQNKYMRPDELNEQSKGVIGSITDSAEKAINTDGLRGKTRRGALYVAGEKPIEEYYGPWFTIPEGNGVEERRAAMNSKHAMSSRLAQPVTDIKDRLDHLQRTDPKSHAAINQLMQLTEFGLNPLRPWDKQIAEVRESKNAANLKAILEKAHPLVSSLVGKKQLDLYHDLRADSENNMLGPKATGLHLDVTADKLTASQIDAFKTAPMDEFMAKAAAEEMDIQGTREFWHKAITDRINALEQFLGAQKQSADKLQGREKRDVLSHVDTLEKSATDLRALLKRLADVPYFHLGRDGDFFVDMKLRTLPNGQVDPKALTEAAEHLEPFGTVISAESSQDHVYIRVKDEVAQRNLLNAAYELQKRGVVRKDQRDDAKPGQVEHMVQSGKRDDARVRNIFAPQWLSNFIERINGNDEIEADDKKRLIEEARSAALDIMPDNSLAKVLTQRKAVPGFDPNMFNSFFDRQKIGIDAHVGMAVAPKITEAFGKMRLAIDRAQGEHTDKVSINQKNGMTDVLNELSRRDRERPNIERTPVIDAVRQATNTWALGLSPAFVAMQIIQIPQLVYPRLGAKYGFVKAAKAMSGSTTQALAIMRQVFKDGWDVSAARSFDAVISLGALQRAGVPKSTAEYLMHLANTGQLDIGGPARELTRAVDGSAESPLHAVQRFASAPGYYAETFSRVLTALAHRKLNSELSSYDAAQAAAPFIEDTLWNYAQDMQGRLFGKRGIAGQATPLMTQFMTYTSQLVQRLYLDMHAAVGGDREALKFLLGHVAATTVFAGTLGLPFATMFAAAFDFLKDQIEPDDEPSNIQASYRNWLGDVFGKDVGEAIAKGASRLAGVDISSRVGEQDIFPFSKFLADRRALKDKLKDLEARSWGAPASLGSQALQGASTLMDGDVIGGMSQMLPVGLGSLVKSYRMSRDGYVDAAGKQLPISTPSTNAILAQALGFSPSQMAEYREAKYDSGVRKGIIVRQASNLRDQIADALIGNDPDTARDLIGQASKFDAANPSFAVLPTIEGSIRQRARQRALAATTRTPLGVSYKDLAGQQLTRYANVDYGPQ